MQTKFVEIRGFSWLFDEKIANFRFVRIYRENSRRFAVTIAFKLANFRAIDSLASKIDFESSSEISSCSINDFESSSNLSLCFAQFSFLSKFFVSFEENIANSNLPWWFLQMPTLFRRDLYFTMNCCYFGLTWHTQGISALVKMIQLYFPSFVDFVSFHTIKNPTNGHSENENTRMFPVKLGPSLFAILLLRHFVVSP